MKHPKKHPENEDTPIGAWPLIAALVLMWGGIGGGLYLHHTWSAEPDQVIVAPVKTPIVPAPVVKPIANIIPPVPKETIYTPHFPKTGGIVYTVK